MPPVGQQTLTLAQHVLTTPLSSSSMSAASVASASDDDVTYVHGTDGNLYIHVDEKKKAPKKLQFEDSPLTETFATSAPDTDPDNQPQLQQDSTASHDKVSNTSALVSLRYVANYAQIMS